MSAPPPSYSNSEPPGYAGSKGPNGSNGFPSEKGLPSAPNAGSSSSAAAGAASVGRYATVRMFDDVLRLIGFQPNVTNVVETAVDSAWPKGIQARGRGPRGSFDFKLKGRPWKGFRKDAVFTRQFMTSLFRGLATHGWHLTTAAYMSHSSTNRDTLIFRAGPCVQRTFFAVSFTEHCKIQLIDSPCAEVTAAFLRAANTWPHGLFGVKEKQGNALQLKLRGNPWDYHDSINADTMHASVLLMDLLAVMEDVGYELAMAINLTSGAPDGMAINLTSGAPDGRDPDTLFFVDKL